MQPLTFKASTILFTSFSPKSPLDKLGKSPQEGKPFWDLAVHPVHVQVNMCACMSCTLPCMHARESVSLTEFAKSKSIILGEITKAGVTSRISSNMAGLSDDALTSAWHTSLSCAVREEVPKNCQTTGRTKSYAFISTWQSYATASPRTWW